MVTQRLACMYSHLVSLGDWRVVVVVKEGSQFRVSFLQRQCLCRVKIQYSLPSEIFNCQQTSNCIPQTLPRKDNYTTMHSILPIEAIICPLICLSPPRASPSVGRYLRRRAVREFKKPFGRLPTFSSGKAVAAICPSPNPHSHSWMNAEAQDSGHIV
jgi:hypothetical protein